MNATGHINGTNFQTYIKDTITLGQKYTFSWHQLGVDVADVLLSQNNGSWSQLSPPGHPALDKQEISTATKNKVIIMSTGSLNMRLDCISHFSDVVVPLLSQAIAKTKETMGDNVKLVYGTQSPIREIVHSVTGLLNNVAIGVANVVIIDALHNLNVTVVDGYTMQLSRFKRRC